MAKWCVKIRQYTGGTSVLGVFATEQEATAEAVMHNHAYQTDKYYVEEWSLDKIQWPNLSGKEGDR